MNEFWFLVSSLCSSDPRADLFISSEWLIGIIICDDFILMIHNSKYCTLIFLVALPFILSPLLLLSLLLSFFFSFFCCITLLSSHHVTSQQEAGRGIYHTHKHTPQVYTEQILYIVICTNTYKYYPQCKHKQTHTHPHYSSCLSTLALSHNLIQLSSLCCGAYH